jgi:hypothetical protein
MHERESKQLRRGVYDEGNFIQPNLSVLKYLAMSKLFNLLFEAVLPEVARDSEPHCAL